MMKKVRECENSSPKSSKIFRIFVFLFQNGQKEPKTLNSAILIITARLRILKVMFLYILTIRLGWLHQLSRVSRERNSPTQPMGRLCRLLKSWFSKQRLRNSGLIPVLLVPFRPSLPSLLIAIGPQVSRI